MKNKRIKPLAYVLAIAFLAILFVIFFIPVIYNRSFAGDKASKLGINIGKGSYNATIQYSAKDDTYVETYIKSRGNDYVIQGFILPAAYEENVVNIELNVPYSVRNSSFKMRTPYNEKGTINISGLNIKYIGSKSRVSFMLAMYVIIAALMLLFTIQDRDRLLLVLFVGFSFLVLGTAFINNPLFMFLYLATVGFYWFSANVFVRNRFENVSIVFRTLDNKSRTIKYLKEKIRILPTSNMQIYIGFFTVMLVVMCLFTTSSPLYAFKQGQDENIYYSIATGMANGLDLYKDMFDHKGPVFFFVYMLAYFVNPGEFTGVYLLEVIMLSLSVFMVYKLTRLYTGDIASIVAAFASIPILFNQNYTREGGSLEQMYISLMLLALYFVIRGNMKSRTFMLEGVIFAIVFFSKFNLSLAWPFMMVFVAIRFIGNKDIKGLFRAVLCYISGFMVVAILACIAFVIKGQFSVFIDSYFLFNMKYGAVTSVGDTVRQVILRYYSAILDNKLSFFLAVTGIAGITLSVKYCDIYARFMLPLVYIATVFLMYAGTNSYEYYYSIIAGFACFGIVVITAHIYEKLPTVFLNRRLPIVAASVCVLMTFTVNKSMLDSFIFDTEPSGQDVLVYEMNRLSEDGDVSFFEYDMLESGFYKAANAAPYVKYFFYPNIDDIAYSGVREEQISYIEEARTEYILFERYSNEDYVNDEVVLKAYDFANMYETQNGTGKTYFLYKRKHN